MDSNTHLEFRNDPRLHGFYVKIRLRSEANTPGISDDDLREFLRELDGMPVNSPSVLTYRRAMRAMADHNERDAIALAQAVAKDDPSIAAVAYNLVGLSHLRLHNYTEAYEAFLKVKATESVQDVAEQNAFEAAWFRQIRENNTDLMARFFDDFPGSQLPGMLRLSEDDDAEDA
ncbi:MAG: hypothetical protein ACOCZ8_01225 [Bacteroidota bacterium]